MAEKGHQQLKAKAAFFYADYGMVASTDPRWLQLAFTMLTGLFDRVGPQKNIQKIVRMVCRTFRADRLRANKAYTQKMTGDGRSFKEWQQERVLSLEYGKDMGKRSPVTHHQAQHGVAKGGLVSDGSGADK